MTKWDLALCGAGPAGLACALALGRQGKRVLVVDVALSPLTNYGQRTLALTAANMDWLHGLGATFNAHPITGLHISVQGRWGSTLLKAQEAGVSSLGAVISFSALMKSLYEQLQALPNVQCHFGVTLSALQFSSNVWRFKLNPLEETIHEASLLGLADGAKSRLALDQGITYTHKDYRQVAILSNIKVRTNGISYERFFEHGAMALLPLSNTEATFVLTVDPHRAARYQMLADDAYLAMIQSAFGYRAGVFKSSTPRISIPLHAYTPSAQTFEHGILLGSAAHHFHPIAAQGLNLGLYDLQILANIFSNKDALDDIPEALLAYESQVAPLQNPIIHHTNFIQSWFHRSSFLTLSAGMLGLMNQSPWCRQWVAKTGAGLGGAVAVGLRSLVPEYGSTNANV